MQQPLDSDVLVIGAGPAGLALAISLGQAGLSVIVLDTQGRAALSAPKDDGREIALTHDSVALLKKLGIWPRLAAHEIGVIREAQVHDGGHARALLDFNAQRAGSGGGTGVLGWIVPNHALRRASFEVADALPALRIVCNAQTSQVRTLPSHAEVFFEAEPAPTGGDLRARLLVAADSRFSTTRRQLGIGADLHDFGRTMVVCRMQHAQPHGEVAHECFGYERTLAVLPLTGDASSVVLTADASAAAALMALPAADFTALVQRQFHDRLGRMAMAGERHAYPLVATYAHRFRSMRSALVGDAAVGMHPVTAHGYNLGLQGVGTLAGRVVQAHRAGQDIGAASLLAAYEATHRRHTRLIYHGTNAVAKLYADKRAPLRLLRQLVLEGAQRFPPLKAAITRQLTGHGPFGDTALAAPTSPST
ncbi:5-demethoxyubiquinol-8 5-hydroxylase UbiM [Variovorax sp. N23]|uniref:5-demethoxyubiquinol-8 5-hydroxylase UbiM n=1 Tax=Variovorax sp. N23 TaxID=2980555 RepID=UPI0021C9ED7E|nr:5-demethoxyubiquinol-8 5-hydroxylase UbiM [Variovorax sp. N23]MCU4118066.1 5-demethoxyubiquinol-8 5-hydroxylase UbiM [Variovorax sp. N23]